MDSSHGYSRHGSDDDSNDDNNDTSMQMSACKRRRYERKLLDENPLVEKRVEPKRNRGCDEGRVPSNKRTKTDLHFRGSHEVLYEVREIIDCRIAGVSKQGQLEYRASWVGYKPDLTWYRASNFKGSPHKLREFHDKNPESLRPKRLQLWIYAWEETNEHPDDDLPDERTGKE